MSGNLIKIGLTGLNAHQSALSTTGNNVSNANTVGYSRQRVTFESNPSQFLAGGYQGTGVNISSIERITSQFVVNQLRLDSTTHSEYSSLLGFVSQVDSLLADPATGLAPGINNFFKALQGAADDPSSLPERTLLLSETEGMINRFNTVFNRLNQLGENVSQEMSTLTAQVNSLASGIAELNTAIVVATKSGSQPNDLLDKREELMRQLSEIVSVSAVEQSDGRINVFIGKGQALVVGNRTNSLEVQVSNSDPSRKDVVFNENGTRNVITAQLTGGKMGGILHFRDQILPGAINSVGQIALSLADTVNQQHQLGIDLESNLGGLYFTDINSREAQLSRVVSNKQNALPADRVVGVEITDTNLLKTDDYELQFGGPSNNHYAVVNKSSGDVITQGVLTGLLPASIEFDGVRVNLESGSFQQGDRFLLTPTRNAANQLGTQVNRPQEIALAFPVRAEANLGNTGSASISAGQMLDVRSPATDQLLPAFAVPGQISPPLLVRFITDDVYEVLDNSNPANPVALNPPLNNQIYRVSSRNDLFTTDPGETMVRAGGAGSNVAQVPAAVASPGPFANGYGAQTLNIQGRDPATGVVTSYPPVVFGANTSAKEMATTLSALQGVRANAYTDLTLSNFTDDGAGAGLGISVNGQALTITPPDVFGPETLARLINENSSLQDQNVFAISDGTNLRIRSSSGEDITIEVTGTGGDSVDVSTAVGGPVTVTGGNGTRVGGYLDLTLSDGVTLSANNNNVFQTIPTAQSTYRGFQFSLTGVPKQGDRFSIGYNTDGVSDNRNALAMIGLETSGTMNGGTATYTESYSQLVEVVGTVTSQTRTDEEASESLLRQSENRWQEMSGVNLDEEAGRLIQFQAAYNASAKVMGIARELFDTLIATFR